MLGTVLIVTGILVVIFAVVVSMQPSIFSVTRTAVIHAPPEELFLHVNEIQKWLAWSPWARMDPDAKVEFEGPAAGRGAVFKWQGNKTGEGVMTITESRPNDLILFRLEFIKPFKAVNKTEFTFTPQAEGTFVSWTMSGPNNFMGKCMGLLMNCEKMVGGQFEEGLNNLQEVVTTSRG